MPLASSRSELMQTLVLEFVLYSSTKYASLFFTHHTPRRQGS